MTAADWVSRISTVVLAVASLGGIAGLVLIPRNRRRLAAGAVRDDAEAVKLLTDASVDAAAELREQLKSMTEMRVQLNTVRGQLDEAEHQTRQLIADLEAAHLRARVAEERATRAESELVRLTEATRSLQDELARRRTRRRPDPPPPAQAGNP